MGEQARKELPPVSKLVVLRTHAKTVAVNPELVVYVEKASNGALIHFSADASWPDGKPTHVTLHTVEEFGEVVDKLDLARAPAAATLTGQAFLQDIAAIKASLRA
jgi:hypothetical protein